MRPKTTILYKLSVLLMLLVTGAVFVMTLLHIKQADVFGGSVTVCFLVLTALLTAVCICFEIPRGKRLYQCGFFILHGGLVILLCGFLLSRFLGSSYINVVYEGSSIVDAYDEETLTENSENPTPVPLGLRIGVTDANIEYYTDENGIKTENVKHYEATLTVIDGRTGEQTEKVITMNHPLRIHGNRSYKVYLMGIQESYSPGIMQVSLTLKSDPAEYTILAGIILTIVGSVLMCLIAPISFSKRKSAEKNELPPALPKEKTRVGKEGRKK